MERWHPFGLSTTDRWEPFRVSDIQGEVNRLFDNFFGRPATTTGRAWVPPVDMYATKDDLVLTLELPGVSEKDVTVSITADLLTVKGERRFEESGQGAGAPPRRADLREVRAADPAADGRAG
jgi:HSP20 family protein